MTAHPGRFQAIIVVIIIAEQFVGELCHHYYLSESIDSIIVL
jgi:hypothetical protein